MLNLDRIIRQAREAMCTQDFGGAEIILQRGLLNFTNREEKSILLQHLAHLYEHPMNENLEKAEAYILQRESTYPCAYGALANAYFQFHSKHDNKAARWWADTAKTRAVEERDVSTIYSASSMAGLLAAIDGDWVAAMADLDQIEIVLESPSDTICLSDAVSFLEQLEKGEDQIAAKARHVAGLIAPKIEDEDFRTRAEVVAGLAKRGTASR